MYDRDSKELKAGDTVQFNSNHLYQCDGEYVVGIGKPYPEADTAGILLINSNEESGIAITSAIYKYLTLIRPLPCSQALD